METTEQQVRDEFRQAWDAYRAAQDKADAAFIRWFEKIRDGKSTNGAAASRMANEANYRSADVAVAANACYRMQIDPRSIVPEYEEM